MKEERGRHHVVPKESVRHDSIQDISVCEIARPSSYSLAHFHSLYVRSDDPNLSRVPCRQPDDPLFDFDAIVNEPLRAKILHEKKTEGIVIQEIEYDGGRKDGQPVRVFGILAYPEGGRQLPAVFWSQSGMAPAGEYFPVLFARRGYFCLNVTLDHNTWQSFAPFDTSHPKDANLTALAHVQMRGITYLATRPQVDRDRVGVAGASYGGFFATLIAGADPRIKAGMAFFAAGHHHLGTNLPQFTGLQTQHDLEVWQTTIDPGWRLRHRAVPFLWGVGSNDHWFHLPAIFKTYADSVGEKRLAVAVPWGHALPANLDEQLLSWFDIYLKKNRPPLNQVGDLNLAARDGRLSGSWQWTGVNRVTKAELVVSYGPASPWHEWVHRAHFTVPATISGESAAGEIPVPEPGLEVYVFASITDEHDAVITTLPQLVRPMELGISRPTSRPSLNGFFQGDFEPDDITYFQRSGLPCGTVDRQEKHSGEQSIRLDGGQPATFKLFHVPGRSHRLRLWLKSDKDATVVVKVVGLPPENDHSPLIRTLRASASSDARRGEDPGQAPPSFTVDVQGGRSWQEVRLPCPYGGQPLAGYELQITPQSGSTCWVDDARFEPVWND